MAIFNDLDFDLGLHDNGGNLQMQIDLQAHATDIRDEIIARFGASPTAAQERAIIREYCTDALGAWQIEPDKAGIIAGLTAQIDDLTGRRDNLNANAFDDSSQSLP